MDKCIGLNTGNSYKFDFITIDSDFTKHFLTRGWDVELYKNAMKIKRNNSTTIYNKTDEHMGIVVIFDDERDTFHEINWTEFRLYYKL